MYFVDWWLAMIIAVLATFGVWAALTKWLKIQLPAGVLRHNQRDRFGWK